jgi:hypothetical protein
MAGDPFAAHKSEPEHELTPVIADPPANPFAEQELEPERPKVPPSAQQLLCWIQQGWGRPTISLRDIQVYGPGLTIRKREIALDLTKILVRQGWLVPMKAWRHDRQVWRLPPPGANPVSDTTR